MVLVARTRRATKTVNEGKEGVVPDSQTIDENYPTSREQEEDEESHCTVAPLAQSYQLPMSWHE